MSFSSCVKEELSKISNLANKEQVRAEWIGYLLTSNTTVLKNKIRYCTENEYNINRFHKLLTNLQIPYNIQLQGKIYNITFTKQEEDSIFYEEHAIQIKPEAVKQPETLQKAFIRGAFLGSGSLNNPNQMYHLEILFSTKKNAQIISQLLKQFTIENKLLERKKSYSIYCKDSEEISKFLALIGANKAVLEFEQVRVVRETRNSINRLINCETANLNKTINAAVDEVRAITKLKEKKQFDKLSKPLQEIANLRLENPDATLIELGEMLENPIGKSGVNHRLKKICQIANEIEEDR